MALFKKSSHTPNLIALQEHLKQDPKRSRVSLILNDLAAVTVYRRERNNTATQSQTYEIQSFSQTGAGP